MAIDNEGKLWSSPAWVEVLSRQTAWSFFWAETHQVNWKQKEEAVNTGNKMQTLLWDAFITASTSTRRSADDGLQLGMWQLPSHQPVFSAALEHARTTVIAKIWGKPAGYPLSYHLTHAFISTKERACSLQVTVSLIVQWAWLWGVENLPSTYFHMCLLFFACIKRVGAGIQPACICLEVLHTELLAVMLLRSQRADWLQWRH